MSFEDEKNEDFRENGFRQQQREKKENRESSDRYSRDDNYSRGDRPRNNYDRNGSNRGFQSRDRYSSNRDGGRDSGYQSRDRQDRQSSYSRQDTQDRFTPVERGERRPENSRYESRENNSYDRGDRNSRYQSRSYSNDYQSRNSYGNSNRSDRSQFGSRDSFGTNAPYEQKQRPYATKQARPQNDDFFAPQARAPRESFGEKSFDRPFDKERAPREFNDRPRNFGDRPQRDFKPRDFGDRPQRDFGDRPQRDFNDRPREGRTSRFREMTDNLFGIDKEILHLLFKRAEFLQQVKRDNRVEPALEKKLRNSWERGAARVTRDPRIARDFFNLLQQIEPIPLVDGVPMYFNLAPVFTPSKIDLDAPVSSSQLRAFLAIAAATGATTSFKVDLSPTMMSAIKAFNQLGGQLWWEGDGRVLSRGGEGVTRHIDRVIPVGEDAFTFYLSLAMALLVPSRLKFVGDGSLRFLSTSELRKFLPQLNCRMSVVIPGHDGIPVRAESVGMLPQTIHFPQSLPTDFIISLIVVSVARKDSEGSLDFHLDNHPEERRILTEVTTILDELDIPHSSEKEGKVMKISFTPVEPSFGEVLQVELDPVVSSTLLAIPAFVGGRCLLRGSLNSSDDVYINFLKSSGLSIEIEGNEIIAERKGNALLEPDYAMSPSYPMALVFAALSTYNGFDVKIPPAPEEVDDDIIKGFLEQVGLEANEEGILQKIAPNANPWFVPSAEWGLALSLAAFIRPHIRITNPDIVSAVYPTFWKIYNALATSNTQATVEANETVEEENTVRRYVVKSPIVNEVTVIKDENLDNNEDDNEDDKEASSANLLDSIEHFAPKEYDEDDED